MSTPKNILTRKAVLRGMGAVVVMGLMMMILSARRGPSGTSSTVELVTPPDRMTSPRVHRFVWRRLGSSTLYRFHLYEVSRAPVWSALVRDTSLAVPNSVELRKGRTYLWRVEAILPDETTMDSELRAFTLSW